MAKKGEAWRYDETEKSRKKNDGHCGWQKLSEKKFDARHRSAEIYSDIAKRGGTGSNDEQKPNTWSKKNF